MENEENKGKNSEVREEEPKVREEELEQVTGGVRGITQFNKLDKNNKQSKWL